MFSRISIEHCVINLVFISPTVESSDHRLRSLAAANGSGSHTKSPADGNTESAHEIGDDDSADPQLCEENAIAVSALSVLDEVTRFRY